MLDPLRSRDSAARRNPKLENRNPNRWEELAERPPERFFLYGVFCIALSVLRPVGTARACLPAGLDSRPGIGG